MKNPKVKGRIAEVFDSLQGEGIYLGERQIFVRFFGCNLTCKFCDTPLAHFTEYEPKELLSEIKLYHDDHSSIAFTGGEPLLQKDFLKEMLQLTSEAGYKNYLETNGVLYAALEEVIDYVDVVAMDLKLPSSTGLNNFWQEHREFLKVASQKEVFLKMVICHSTRKKDIIESLRLIKEINKPIILILQPNSFEDYEWMRQRIESFRNVARYNDITASIIFQIHKKIGLR